MDKNLSLIWIGREMSPIINSSVILPMSQRALISRLEARAQCCCLAFVPFQPSGRYSKVSETVKQRAKCVVFYRSMCVLWVFIHVMLLLRRLRWKIKKMSIKWDLYQPSTPRLRLSGKCKKKQKLSDPTDFWFCTNMIRVYVICFIKFSIGTASIWLPN